LPLRCMMQFVLRLKTVDYLLIKSPIDRGKGEVAGSEREKVLLFLGLRLLERAVLEIERAAVGARCVGDGVGPVEPREPADQQLCRVDHAHIGPN
jgi:hypothetical protein